MKNRKTQSKQKQRKTFVEQNFAADTVETKGLKRSIKTTKSKTRTHQHYVATNIWPPEAWLAEVSEVSVA